MKNNLSFALDLVYLPVLDLPAEHQLKTPEQYRVFRVFIGCYEVYHNNDGSLCMESYAADRRRNDAVVSPDDWLILWPLVSLQPFSTFESCQCCVKRTPYEIYRDLHKCCPECFSSDIATTTVGSFIHDLDTHTDTNKAWCQDCGFEGIIHDLKPIPTKPTKE